MTKLARLADGIGRIVDDAVELISTGHGDLAALFADESFDPAQAKAISSAPLSEVERRPWSTTRASSG